MKIDFDEDANITTDDEVIEGGHSYQHHHNVKIMTMEDVAEHLKANFADEIKDSKHYLCMAKVADKAGHMEDCHYLTEMAKDEYTHAYFIYNFMQEHDIPISKEHEKDFKELHHNMKEFF